MPDRKIVVMKDGPYLVCGGIDLVWKLQISSEYGEPLTWQKTADLETEEVYKLCRCGQSKNKPFCDDTHEEVGFDGTERAAKGTFERRKVIYPGSTGIVIKRDYYICSDAGFCGNRFDDVQSLAEKTGEPIVRAQVIAMIERCPSGSFTYALEKGAEDIEPDLPVQIAVTTEMSDEGPIVGPLWVTGYILVERADQVPMEVRNRVTLCRCGHSRYKPLCDGSHRALHIEEEDV